MEREDRLKQITQLLDKANTTFHEAIVADTVSERKELLEQALREYAEILPLLNPCREDIWGRLAISTVLDKIHAVEAWIEQEIERTVFANTREVEEEEVVTARLAVD